MQPWIFCSISKPGYLAPFVVIFYHQGECCSIRIKKIRRLPFRPDDLRTKPGGKGLEDESVVAFSVNLIAKFHPDDFQDSRFTFINRDECLDLGLTIAFTLNHSVASALFL